MSESTLYRDDCFTIMEDLIEKGIKVDAIITDPPYGMTACKWDTPIDLKRWWELVHKLLKKDGNVCVFSKQPFTTTLNASNIKEYKSEIIWEKQQATDPMHAKIRVMPIHENISIFYSKFGTYNPQMRYGFGNYTSFMDETKQTGEIYQTKSVHRECNDGSRYPISVVKYSNVRKSKHPTQKPLELVKWLVKTYTNEGDVVLDTFMGSGTTGLACRDLNRNFIGIELDQEYFNTACNRINKINEE